MTIEQIDRLGIIRTLTLRQAVAELVKAGWSEFAARDWLRHYGPVRVGECCYQRATSKRRAS